MCARRRDNGMGSICQGSDGRWRAKVHIGFTEDGKRKWKQFVGGSEAEVKSKLREYNRTARLISKDTSGVLYSDFLNQWLYSKKIFSLKPSSFDRLESTVLNHIVPALGSDVINDITPIILQEFINQKVREGLSYSSIKKIYDAINASLRDAMFPPVSLPYNPAQVVELPKKRTLSGDTKVKYFSHDEVEAIKREVNRTYSTGAPVYPYGQAYILILNTGLRCGELLGLRHKDYDPQNGTLTVSSNQTTTKKRDRNGKALSGYETRRTGTVKTYSGVRTLKLNDTAIDAIECLISQFPNAEYIVNNTKGNPLSSSDAIRTFNRILNNAEVEKNGRGVHSLRHTFATYMFKNGVDAKVISEILGHSSVGITYNTYVHVMDDMKAQAMTALPEI